MSDAHPYAGLPVRENADARLAARSHAVATHLAVALARHVHLMNQRGLVVPHEVGELAGILTRSATARHRPPPLDETGQEAHPRGVTSRLLLTKQEAAQRLSVSVRTIERLVATGQLPLVHVDNASRVRVRDLERYVHDPTKIRRVGEPRIHASG